MEVSLNTDNIKQKCVINTKDDNEGRLQLKNNNTVDQSNHEKITANDEMPQPTDDREMEVGEQPSNENEKTQRQKTKKNRELERLEESQILKFRLRSDSGKVYSSSVTVDASSAPSSPISNLSTLIEEEILEEMCLKEDCKKNAKNTEKIIEMISKLQSSVDDVLKKVSTQEIISSNNTHRIEDVQEDIKKNADEIDEIAGELKETQFQLKLVSGIPVFYAS